MQILVANPFIMKLHEIVSDPAYSEVIGWKNKSVFVVHDKERLCEEVLPLFFNHTNFLSFIRQLNMYEFRKRRYHFSEEQEYSHPLFKRKRQDLLP